MVECHLAKVKVAGSNPVSRSTPSLPLCRNSGRRSQVVRQGSAKPLFIGSIPIAASILLWMGTVQAAPPSGGGGPPLYDEVTPASELITLPTGTGDGFLTIRASRQGVRLWGCPLVVLLYSGPLAPGQSERNDGRYSLVTIPRNPSQESQFLAREVWPAVGSPFMAVGGFRGLEPGEILPPDDPRLEILERNLLRAAWYPVALDLGLAGGAVRPRSGTSGASFRRLVEKVILEEERNGFLHESQHALDEAWKVYPDRFQRVVGEPAVAEQRAILAALAHSGVPHYALYQVVRQYRQRLPLYEPAMAAVLPALVAEIQKDPESFGGVRLKRNLMLQFPRLHSQDLRELAARAMATQFAAADQAAGYNLEYRGQNDTAHDLVVGGFRDEVRPEDLPETGGDGEPVAAWQIQGSQVVTHGVHVYLSEHGIRPAQADTLGLAVGEQGYVALLMRAQGGPWSLELRGGLFQEGKTRSGRLPVQVLAGDGRVIAMTPAAVEGTFVGRIEADAAIDGILRIIVRGRPGGGVPAFLVGFRLLSLAAP